MKKSISDWAKPSESEPYTDCRTYDGDNEKWSRLKAMGRENEQGWMEEQVVCLSIYFFILYDFYFIVYEGVARIQTTKTWKYEEREIYPHIYIYSV